MTHEISALVRSSRKASIVCCWLSKLLGTSRLPTLRLITATHSSRCLEAFHFKRC